MFTKLISTENILLEINVFCMSYKMVIIESLFLAKNAHCEHNYYYLTLTFVGV